MINHLVLQVDPGKRGKGAIGFSMDFVSDLDWSSLVKWKGRLVRGQVEWEEKNVREWLWYTGSPLRILFVNGGRGCMVTGGT